MLDILRRRDFHIVSEMHNKVLDISGGNPAAGAGVIVWPKKSPVARNQLWYFDPQGVIHSALNDMVLETKSTSSFLIALYTGLAIAASVAALRQCATVPENAGLLTDRDTNYMAIVCIAYFFSAFLPKKV